MVHILYNYVFEQEIIKSTTIGNVCNLKSKQILLYNIYILYSVVCGNVRPSQVIKTL